MVNGKVKAMAKGKHKPPSRMRYEQSHPTISCRVPKDIYEKLEKIKSKENKSFSDILKIGLGILKAKVKQEDKIRGEAYSQGYNDGYSEAEGEFKVTYRCVVCGKIMTVTSEKAKAAVDEYMREHRWGHTECHEKKGRGYL